MGHNVVSDEGSEVGADPLRGTTFGDALAAVGRVLVFRWTWAEEEIQRLVTEGWDRVGAGELRYTFNTGTGDECGVNVFAEAYAQFEDRYGMAVRLVPGRGRSATWIWTDRLVVLTAHDVRLVKPVGRRSQDGGEAERDDDGTDEVCECHCHCEVEGLEDCHDDDCGDYDEDDCDEAEDDDHDCDEEDCGRRRCDGCHCCTCWKNCGCDFYDEQECGCGCYECGCACFDAIIDVDDRSGDDEPVTVANQWPAFETGLAQVLTRLGKGERINLTAHGRPYVRFQVVDQQLDCAIARNHGVPEEYRLDADQSAWLIQRDWHQYREWTYGIEFASDYDEYVDMAESVVTVLRDFLGIAGPVDLGIETTTIGGTPGASPRCRLEIRG